VTIRNDPGDSTDVVFARLLGAKITFCSTSTYCLFPALGRTNETYIVQAPLYGGSSSWLLEVEKRHNHFHYIKEPMYTSQSVNGKSPSEIVQLLTGDVPIAEQIIAEDSVGAYATSV
jgi:hypothetical protein